MWIMVAGPIMAPTEVQRQANLLALRQACLAVQARGHVPLLAHDLAGPLRDVDPAANKQQHYLDYCLALEARCDAIVMIGHSPGADAEMEAFRRAGKPVYEGLDAVPPLD